MEVDTNVSESDIGAVQGRGEARFTCRGLRGPAIFRGGRPGAPSAADRAECRDLRCRRRRGQSKLQLMPGMTATVKIVTDRDVNVLRVPDQALRFTPVPCAGGTGRRAAGRCISAVRSTIARWANGRSGSYAMANRISWLSAPVSTTTPSPKSPGDLSRERSGHHR